MRILQVASEAVPWAKSGGLADVVGALSSHLVAAGHDVALALPLYRDLNGAGPEVDATAVEVSSGPGPAFSVRASMAAAGFEVWWVDAPDLFDRAGLYGTADGDYPDNALRFATLVRGALGAARAFDWRPDVVHAHDWQAGLTPVYSQQGGEDVPPCVLTIHNIAYQGVFGTDILHDMGLQDHRGSLHQEDLGHNRINFMKQGLLYADLLTTVSPTYAREIMTPEGGAGLDGLLRYREYDLHGILNGLDYDSWDPATDPRLGS